MIRTVADLTAFLAEYHRPWGVEPRLADDVPDRFPPPLWRVYRDLGGLFAAGQPGRRPLGTQDRLTPPQDVTFEDGHAIIAWENQGNWSALIPVEPGAGDDPPVLMDGELCGDGLIGDGPGSRVLAAERLSDWLITFCLREAAMSGPSLVVLDQADTPEEFERAFAGPLTPLWRHGPLFPKASAFGGPGYDVFSVSTPDGGGALAVWHPEDLAWVGRHGGDAAALLKPDAPHSSVH